jgi:ribosomal protein S18 acetylase RimI-like enzyme
MVAQFPKRTGKRNPVFADRVIVGRGKRRGYNPLVEHKSKTVQLLDLRQMQTRDLERLFEEETACWRDELYWDYHPSIDLIRRFVDSHTLGGSVAFEGSEPAGYGFYVLEDHKALIGGLFASPRFSQSEITDSLLSEMLATLRATPRLNRVEAQIMPFGGGLDGVLLGNYFKLYPRQFMMLTLSDAKVKGEALSRGLRIERWSDRNFDTCARLIQLAYANHVDGEINDQYRSEAGGMKFLRNIVILPGCGQFLPEASFVMRENTGGPPIGMVLTSTVAEGVGHTTQICVKPGHRGSGVGRFLMETSIQALKARHFHSLSLTVTALNSTAVKLYEELGFRTIKNFAAGVWRG